MFNKCVNTFAASTLLPALMLHARRFYRELWFSPLFACLVIIIVFKVHGSHKKLVNKRKFIKFIFLNDIFQNKVCDKEEHHTLYSNIGCLSFYYSSDTPCKLLVGIFCLLLQEMLPCDGN